MGVGAHDIIGVEAKNLGFKRTLLMTTGLRGSGIIEELVGKIEYQGVEVVLYDKVESNPKDYNVMEAAALYQKEKCDSIISIGGGSSHDARQGRSRRDRTRRSQTSTSSRASPSPPTRRTRPISPYPPRPERVPRLRGRTSSPTRRT